MDSINIALVGSGNFIRDQHVPAVQSTKRLVVKALYSRSKTSAVAVLKNSGFENEVTVYSEDQGVGLGYGNLLSGKDIDTVLIALPILVQPDYIKKALLAGKHVLSEKPIAKDYSTAKSLISWYHENIDSSTVYWGVAENYRYIPSLQYASAIVASGRIGQVSTFHTHMYASVGVGNLSFATSWRQNPGYQGGFLLDGGVHFVAARRAMIGTDSIVRLSAFTKLTREYLPPVDTVDAVMKTKSGVTGTFSVSFGSSNSGSEYTINGDQGYVSIIRGSNLQGSMSSSVIVRVGKEVAIKEFEHDGTGVREEVLSWAKSLVGKEGLDLMQKPENVLKDLEIVEKMLRSGENDGEIMIINNEDLLGSVLIT